MKKKIFVQNRFWATAQTILCELYCKVQIVLQLKGLEWLAGLRVFMLQYKLYCGWFEGFHIAIHCIVLQEKSVYCNRQQVG